MIAEMILPVTFCHLALLFLSGHLICLMRELICYFCLSSPVSCSFAVISKVTGYAVQVEGIGFGRGSSSSGRCGS